MMLIRVGLARDAGEFAAGTPISRPEIPSTNKRYWMIDKAASVPRAKIGRRIGTADVATMRAVDTALATFLGLG